MNLKQKTISGLFWSFIESFSKQGVQFIVGIILARILSPAEFGLIGMLTVFIAISQTFIDSGFGNALIRKQNCNQNDYSTVFYFNIGTGLFFYFLLFFSAGLISSFFDEPKLKILLQVLGIVLIINSLGIIQTTILTKDLNFRLQTKISLISSIGSGLLALYLAYSGFGVWSLVGYSLSSSILNSAFLWIWSKWKPFLVFDKKSFMELYSFGSKLLFSGLIDTVYRNIYYLIIGKFYSANELGYYTRADQFKNIASQNLSGIIQRVSYPVLSEMQNDITQLKNAYSKIIKSIMFITNFIMLGMAAIAKPMILTLLGEKWMPVVIYLQLLCFIGIFYPLHALNLNILNVRGRSDIFLKLEIIKKAFAIPIIIAGIYFGIKTMIIGMIITSIIAYFINSYWSGRMIQYSSKQQLMDILPSFFLALTVNAIVFCVGFIPVNSPVVLLIFQIITGIILAVLFSEIFKINDYHYLKKLLLAKIH